MYTVLPVSKTITNLDLEFIIGGEYTSKCWRVQKYNSTWIFFKTISLQQEKDYKLGSKVSWDYCIKMTSDILLKLPPAVN